MKRIFHISGTTLPGGGPEHIYQLIKHLNHNEWEFILCTANDGSYWKRFNSLGIKIHNLPLRKLSFSTSLKLFSILRKEKPDLIHTHGKGPGLYGRTIAKILNIPVVHTFHGFHYEDLSIFTRWIHLTVEFFLTLITTQHVFVSAGEKNRAQIMRFLDEENSTIIHNGVDCDYIHDLPITRNKALKSINCSDWENKNIIGTISRISPEKGILDLLSAFSQVIQDMPNLRLIIIGGHPKEHTSYYLDVVNFLEKKQLTKHVRILGYIQDAYKLLKGMDIYVSASLSEGLPISILEAIASKIPIVATEITGNKDILRNSVYGMLVEPNSPQSLAKGITQMLQLTKKEQDTMVENAYNRIKNSFSISEMTQKTRLLYNQVLNQKPLSH
jgi:glycosyltransferase involved in cell wall biosynthesis